MRENRLKKSIINGLIGSMIAIAVLTLTGPFGTYSSMTFDARLKFWFLAILGGHLFIHSSIYFTSRMASPRKRDLVMAIVVGNIIGSVPATAYIMYVFEYVSGLEFSESDFPKIWSNVVLIGTVIATIHVLPEFLRPKSETPQSLVDNTPQTEAPIPAQLEQVPLLAKLADGLRPCQIMSFSMQDHYVEVTTVEGKSLLLMRFSDALSMMGDLRGERVHRSHWVSKRHITDVRKSGRKHVAVLTDGREIPISPSYLDAALTLLDERRKDLKSAA